MAGYLGTKAVFLSTTAASVGGDATIGGDLTVGGGDVTFYEDTGTTAKFFWDASAEKVEIAGSGGLKFTGGGVSQDLVWGSSSSDYAAIRVVSPAAQDVELSFHTTTNAGVDGAPERMRIDNSGNVGIGTSSPSQNLHIKGTTNVGVRIEANSNSASIVNFADPSDTNVGQILYDHTSNYMRFNTNDAERMRIDANGGVMIGTTDTSVYNNSGAGNGGVNIGVAGGSSVKGLISAARDDGNPLELNRLVSNGGLISFSKDGTTVGSIGTDSGGTFQLVAETTWFYLRPNSGNSDAANVTWVQSKINPWDDNYFDLGGSNYRWDDVYATNGSIQTSDQNEKQQIASLTDAEITAAKAISKLFKTFKWNDSVAEKGDAARTHSGVIAQDVEQAMTDAGLNAGDYAFFISTTWWETQTEVPAVEADEENGVEAQEAYTRTDTYDTAEEAPEGATERNRKGIRYPQLLSFIGAATEQRLASIESRLDALEGN